MNLSFLDRMVEERIAAAVRRGEFDNLPGRGQPLSFEDERAIPDDLRLAYKILKNANCIPPELEARREIVRLKDLIAVVDDARDREPLIRELNSAVLRLNLLNRRGVPNEVDSLWKRRVDSEPGKNG